MLRMVLSLVISLFLVMSPIVGQFIDQQTSSFAPESLHIENPVNPTGQSDATAQSSEVSDQNAVSSSSRASNVVQAASAKAAVSGKRILIETQVSEKDMSVMGPAPEVDSDSISQTEAGSKPEVKPEPTREPVTSKQPAPAADQQTPAPRTTTAPQSTTKPKAGETSKPTENPKPTEKPKSTETPKPAEPSKAPEQTQPSTTESVSPSNEKVFDTSKADKGTLGVRYHNTSGKRVKLMVEKGDSHYTYNLEGDGSLETFPLQSGNGEYTVSIMENTTGSKYRFVLTEKIHVNASDSNSAYLGSVQMIKWDSGMAAIKKAAELTSGVSGDEAKVKKIYNYVVRNIRYDSDKLNNLSSSYIPSVSSTYSSKSGICYDFASLTAAMLRNVGIPTKLIMGYADGVNGYHAWNEVYIDGKWRVIDTSYDSQMHEAGASYSMYKSKSSYDKSKTY